MSGIDEIGSRGIPPCPDCGSDTRYWVLRNNADTDLGYLNYNSDFAKDNGEFNMERPVDEVIKTATKMVCSRCKYKANESLLKNAIAAVYKDIRRYPEYVRN